MTLVAKVLGGELALFFVAKALRKDLLYWAPLYGLGGAGISFLTRLLAKAVGDWTAVVQTRASVDVGGVYFTFGLSITAIVGIIAAVGHEEVEGEEGTLTKETVMKSMTACCIGMVISFVALLCSMNKAYVHAFLSKETGNKSIQRKFTDSEDNETKFIILESNKHKWQEAIGDFVKIWLNANIQTWLEEQPEWFKDHAMSTIPEDYIYDSEILARIRTHHVEKIIQERRGSFMGGALIPPPGPIPKRKDEVDEEMGKVDTGGRCRGRT
jgi:hypothetical protein